MQPYHILAINIYTSGSSFTKHGIINISASVQNQYSYEVANFDHNITLMPEQSWELPSLKDFWLRQLNLSTATCRYSLAPAKAMAYFVEFESVVEQLYPNLFITSNNPSCDIAWLNLYINRFTERKILNFDINGNLRKIYDAYSMQQVLLATKQSYDSTLNCDLPIKLGFSSQWQSNVSSLNNARIIADYYNQTLKELESVQLIGETINNDVIDLINV